jgi:hypothetical protein
MTDTNLDVVGGRQRAEPRSRALDRRTIACLIVLLIAGGATAYFKRSDVSYYWDVAYSYHDAWRVKLGQLPFRDFETGYLFGASLLTGTILKAIDGNVGSYLLMMIPFWALQIGLTFVIGLRLVGPTSALAAALFAVIGSLANWYLNPGNLVQICALATLLFLLRYIDSDHPRELVLAALSASAALLFKQSGVILIVASFNAVALLLLVTRPLAVLWRVSLAAIAVSLLAGFATFQILKPANNTPAQNYLVLTTWLISASAVVIAAYQRRELGTETIWRQIGAVLLGAAPIVGATFAFFHLNGIDIGAALYRSFIYYPGVVQLAQGPLHRPPLLIALLIVCIIIFLILLRTRPQLNLGTAALGISQLLINFWRKLGRFAVGKSVRATILAFPLVLIAVMIARPNYLRLIDPLQYLKSTYEALAYRDGFHWLFIFACVAAVPFLSRAIHAAQKERRKLAVLVTCSFAGAFNAIAFPWSHHVYSICLIALTLVSLASRIANRPISNFYRCIVVGSLLALLAAGIAYERPRFTTRIDNPLFNGRLRSNERPYLDLAEKIAALPPGETVYAYPNLGFSMALAGRPPQTRYGNYLGNITAELDALIADVLAKHIDWIIVSHKHFGAEYYEQYLVASIDKFVADIQSAYEVDHSDDIWTFYRLKKSRSSQ